GPDEVPSPAVERCELLVTEVPGSSQIGLVQHRNEGRIADGSPGAFLQGDRGVEGVAPGSVDDHEMPGRAAKIRWLHALKLVLAAEIPDDQVDRPLAEMDAPRVDPDADGGGVALAEHAAHEP